MTESPHRSGPHTGVDPVIGRRTAVAGLAALFTASAAATTLLAGRWRDVTGVTGIVALGCGSSLSVLVRTSRARLLIAAGDDPDAFDRAWGSVSRPTTPRLDVLISAGRAGSAAVPEHVLQRRRPGLTLAIVSPGVEARASGLAGEGVTVLRRPIRLDMSDGVSVEVEPPRDDDVGRWHVVIGHGDSRVLLVPDLGSSEPPPGMGAVSATVILAAPRQLVETVPGSGAMVSAATPRGECPFVGARRVAERDVIGDQAVRVAWVVADGDAIAARFQPGQVAFERRGAWHLPTAEI